MVVEIGRGIRGSVGTGCTSSEAASNAGRFVVSRLTTHPRW